MKVSKREPYCCPAGRWGDSFHDWVSLTRVVDRVLASEGDHKSVFEPGFGKEGGMCKKLFPFLKYRGY